MPNNVGVKMSMDGYDVKTAPENKLVFTSKYPSLKIHSEGSGSHTFAEVGGDITLTTHDLGYRPFFIVWVKSPPNANKKITSFRDVYDDWWYVQYIGTATDTLLKLVNVNSWVGGAMNPPTVLPNRLVYYDWIIFYDPIKDV